MKRVALFIISFYQVVLATSLRAIGLKTECRYSPTCSDYTKRVILKHGILKGSALGFKRILSCQSFF